MCEKSTKEEALELRRKRHAERGKKKKKQNVLKTTSEMYLPAGHLAVATPVTGLSHRCYKFSQQGPSLESLLTT